MNKKEVYIKISSKKIRAKLIVNGVYDPKEIYVVKLESIRRILK